jgi:hypothetical protein
MKTERNGANAARLENEMKMDKQFNPGRNNVEFLSLCCKYLNSENPLRESYFFLNALNGPPMLSPR